MSESINVLPLQTTTIDQSGSYDPVFISASSSIIVQRDANTPANDAVAVTFGGLSVGLLSSITVQSGASLTLSDTLGLNVLSTFNIGSDSTLTLAPSNGLSLAIPINFTGPDATLATSQSGLQVALINPISGFNASDTVDFKAVSAATSAQYANGLITVYNGLMTVASIAVTGSFSGTTLSVAPDGNGGFKVGDNVGVVNTRLSGAISDYNISVAGSTDYVKDSVIGRDTPQVVAEGQTLGFSDGVAVVDPSGVAEVITHLYQALLGRAPDLSGLLSATNAVTSGALPYANLATGFVNGAAAEFAAKYGSSVSNTQFVNILEQNTGGNAADPSAQVAINQLNTGVSRAALTFVFAESANGIAATSSYAGDPYYSQVYRLYETTLGRIPDAGGSASFTSGLLNGETPSQVAQTMLDSAEFASKFGAESNTAFVGQLYQNALGRAPDPGAQTFINSLNAGASRADVALTIGNSSEARADFATATHDGFVFLHA